VRLQLGLTPFLVGRQGGAHAVAREVVRPPQLVGQRDHVLEGKGRAEADGEVRGVRAVAGQHYVAVVPPLVAHRAEVQPPRVHAVRELRPQPPALELVGEDLLEHVAGAARRGVAEAECGPRPFLAFNDERAGH
jgi:hypothetical protein